MPELKSVAVYCGSRTGGRPVYAQTAYALGATLARQGIMLVYGGGQIGLMGAVAKGALDAGGKVHGVIPEALAIKEIAATDLTDIEVVPNMHVRKARMAELSDGFIALPGGLGTMEELMEVLTWAQLGWHGKPIALLDVGGFYGLLDQFLHHLVTEGFVAERDRRMLLNGSSPDEVLALMRAYVPPSVPSYLERSDL